MKNNNYYYFKADASRIKDFCLFYGLPCVAMLAIGLLPTIVVSADFPDDMLIKSATYAASCILLGLLYVICQSQLQELAPRILLLDRIVKAMHSRIACNTVRNNEYARELEENVLPRTDVEQTEMVINQSRTNSYELRTAEADTLREQNKAALRKAVSDYIYHAISPFAKESEVAIVHDEVLAWMDDHTHIPNPTILSGRKDDLGLKNERLTSIDLRHFIWNIAKRLGAPNKYTGQVMAVFAKTLFPNEFALTEIDSIRNFTVSPSSSHIHIDKPDSGSVKFHYDNADVMEK